MNGHDGQPTHDALLNRRDARRNVEAGADAYDMLCLFCGAVRGTYCRSRLPEPGICWPCRGGDPREYWSRDWTKDKRV